MSTSHMDPTQESLWKIAEQAMATFRLYVEELHAAPPDGEERTGEQWRGPAMGRGQED